MSVAQLDMFEAPAADDATACDLPMPAPKAQMGTPLSLWAVWREAPDQSPSMPSMHVDIYAALASATRWALQDFGGFIFVCRGDVCAAFFAGVHEAY